MTNTKRLHPAHRPNPNLPTSTAGNTPTDRAVRSAVLDAWARQWGSHDELVTIVNAALPALVPKPHAAPCGNGARQGGRA